MEQNGHIYHTAQKTSSLPCQTSPVLSAQVCLIHPQPIQSLTSLFVVLFKQKCFSAFPLFCSLLRPTYGQTLPRMNCKAMSQASFKPSPSDSPFSDLVWFASLQRLMPWEHSACYVSKRARLKCVCPSYRLAWLFLHTPHPTHTQLMPLALGFS